jgi:hypothetical protein
MTSTYCSTFFALHTMNPKFKKIICKVHRAFLEKTISPPTVNNAGGWLEKCSENLFFPNLKIFSHLKVHLHEILDFRFLS